MDERDLKERGEKEEGQEEEQGIKTGERRNGKWPPCCRLKSFVRLLIRNCHRSLAQFGAATYLSLLRSFSVLLFSSLLLSLLFASLRPLFRLRLSPLVAAPTVTR